VPLRKKISNKYTMGIEYHKKYNSLHLLSALKHITPENGCTCQIFFQVVNKILLKSASQYKKDCICMLPRVRILFPILRLVTYSSLKMNVLTFSNSLSVSIYALACLNIDLIIIEFSSFDYTSSISRLSDDRKVRLII
jgi:hypothetical protein